MTEAQAEAPLLAAICQDAVPTRTDLQERQASWLELFFDLVLVAAVAALARQLHEDHSLEGLAVFAGLFVPVWWTWWGFTWYSSAFNADDGVTRVAFLVAMAGVGALASGISGAARGARDHDPRRSHTPGAGRAHRFPCYR